jgi:signal transduction histidine kinase
MKHRLLWSLLIGHVVPVFAIIALLVRWAMDRHAAEYLRVLTERYHISPLVDHRLFLSGIYRDLLWGTLAALALTLFFTYVLTRWVLRPLFQMTAMTKKFADGDYSGRVSIVSRYEVAQLALAFNHMAEKLEKIEALRKNMVIDISHELRTPLTNLRGYLEGLSDSIIPPTPETFHMLEQEALRLVHLVEDLQQLARADAARTFLDPRELSLSQLLHQVIELYRPNFQAKEIEVQWHLEPQSEMIRADRDKLLQAIRNLVDNAWKYTPHKGTVAISTMKTKEGIKTVFANSGAMIAEKDLPYLFERFFRTDRSRTRNEGGAGIGLAIVKELVEAHGGSVGAESDESGTRVWFILPD